MSTGHSLGGALAQLAAHDIATAAAEQDLDIRIGCYTYGSPRVGNHAFAREFDKVVPHCWHVINDQVCALGMPPADICTQLNHNAATLPSQVCLR